MNVKIINWRLVWVLWICFWNIQEVLKFKKQDCSWIEAKSSCMDTSSDFDCAVGRERGTYFISFPFCVFLCRYLSTGCQDRWSTSCRSRHEESCIRLPRWHTGLKMYCYAVLYEGRVLLQLHIGELLSHL